jgi:hypothetical protein
MIEANEEKDMAAKKDETSGVPDDVSKPAGGGGGGGAELFGSKSSGAKDVDIPYPILTEGPYGPPAGGPGAPPSVSSLGQTVTGTLREILGWRPRSGDARGFLAALSGSFTLTEVEGHTEFSWTPKTYTWADQSDMGALTGAQASLHTRTKAAVDQVLPLLEGLHPLKPDADDENVEAHRSIVRSALTELVRELATHGGPRVQRVDSLFALLLGEEGAPKPKNLIQKLFTHRPEGDEGSLSGELGNLEDELGLKGGAVNTIDEEQNLTNFLILVDHVRSLHESWQDYRSSFTRGGKPEGPRFLGTQLVHVSRALAVVAESVKEVYFAMDSVFLGPAERQLVEIEVGKESIFLADLLSWVESVVTEEGPLLIREGGKAGVAALEPTIEKLEELVGATASSDSDALPAGFKTSRVKNALRELAGQLTTLDKLIEEIEAGGTEEKG